MAFQNPVLLVHGIDDTANLFSTLTPYLEQQGWNCHSLDLQPNDGTAGLEVLAQQVADFAAATFDSAQPIDLLGFSMGGLVSRYFVQRLEGIRRVQRFVTISAPHHGSWLAYARWNRGAEQMRPDSPFLQDLNQDAVDMLGQLLFTSIWTPLDAMIVPANSSQMPVGRDVVVNVAMHPWMVTDERVLQEVAIALSLPLPNASAAPATPSSAAATPLQE